MKCGDGLTNDVEVEQHADRHVTRRRWHTAVDEVEGGLPEGVQLQRWQVDTYDSSCYCANFRGGCCFAEFVAVETLAEPHRVHAHAVSLHMRLLCILP